MSIFIVNSITKRKEEFRPLQGNRVNMYSCGVTVYDRCHLGHARSLYVFDVIRRYLKHCGFQVNFIRNITDIDDKIIQRAKDRGVTNQQVAQENIQSYYEDLEALSIDPADVEPKATEHVPDMIRHIEHLIEKGYAYESGGDVYFHVRKFENYGKLSGQGIEKMFQAVRIEKGENKRDPLDFALWKKSKEDEPFWESPWGKGRPGWHIECSVMSLKHLKCQTLDIHAGGRDLIFPHHENEVAQSEALTGKMFAKYWIHHGLLTIHGQKMAKSLGNFITIKDSVEQYGANTLKLFFLSSHYASSIDFSEQKMQDVIKNIERLTIFETEAKRFQNHLLNDLSKLPENIDVHYKEFFEAMDNDFNTPRAIASIFEMINSTYKAKDQQYFFALLVKVNETIQRLLTDIFGFSSQRIQQELTQKEKEMLEQRMQARLQKDFKHSDELREALRENGIIVEDEKGDQKWRRV